MIDVAAQLAENSGQVGSVCALDRPHINGGKSVSVLPVNDSSLSPRTRFEVFKRDEFTCKYCGRTSPEVVLEVDHIVPRCEGGSNDPINLTTACWDCNRGKGGVPLDQVMTGEDPHDRAVMLLERERQLREYNQVLAESRARREAQAGELCSYWANESRYSRLSQQDESWLIYQLDLTPAETIRKAMSVAIARSKVRDLRYVSAILNNWKNEGKL